MATALDHPPCRNPRRSPRRSLLPRSERRRRATSPRRRGGSATSSRCSVASGRSGSAASWCWPHAVLRTVAVQTPQYPIPWLAWPFLLANVLSAVCVTLSIVNGWSTKVTPRRPLVGPDAPRVAVIIPTWGEPVPMVLRTVLSVLEQDYPRDRLHLVVSDDAHNPELATALDGLGVVYHEPPPRDAPGRDGAAKAGNLNSALELVLDALPVSRVHRDARRRRRSRHA